MSGSAQLLAWLVIGWPIFYHLIDWLDKPFTFTYNSLAYWLVEHVALYGKVALGVLVLAGVLSANYLAIVTLAAAGVLLLWGIVGNPFEGKINNGTAHFVSAVALVVGVLMVVLSIVIL